MGCVGPEQGKQQQPQCCLPRVLTVPQGLGCPGLMPMALALVEGNAALAQVQPAGTRSIIRGLLMRMQTLAERVWKQQQERRQQPQLDAFDALAGASS